MTVYQPALAPRSHAEHRALRDAGILIDTAGRPLQYERCAKCGVVTATVDVCIRDVPCPDCGSSAQRCTRPSGHAAATMHAARVTAYNRRVDELEEAGVPVPARWLPANTDPSTGLDLGAFALELRPTVAMRAGSQRPFQCAQCGTLVVLSSLQPDVTKPGECPACSSTTWWEQTFPVQGLHEVDRATLPNLEQAEARGPAAAIAAYQQTRAALDERERDAVLGMLRAGASYADVGRHLGLSKQAVHARYAAHIRT